MAVDVSDKCLFLRRTVLTSVQYWVVHKCNVDVPAMYDRHGRYQYWNGIVGITFSLVTDPLTTTYE